MANSYLAQNSARMMRQKLDVVTEVSQILRDKQDFRLPSIVVIGDESSGKSSILERLAGIELPKGDRITTRNPIVINIRRISPNQEEYVTVGVQKPKLETRIHSRDFHRIGDHLRDFTDILSGQNYNITQEEIILTAYKHDVIDLTLTDLPGIRFVRKGDQPKNIHEQIRRMVLSYIDSPECIVLCVCEATANFGRCENIELSQQVDPEGKRTIGVCTKVDDAIQMGIDVIEKLTSTAEMDAKFVHGWFALRNRSRKDIESRMSLEEALARETTWFQDALPSFPPDRKGVQQLQAYLARVLNESFDFTLPKISERLTKKVEQTRKNLKSARHKSNAENKEAHRRLEKLRDEHIKKVSQSYLGSTQNRHLQLQYEKCYVNYLNEVYHNKRSYFLTCVCADALETKVYQCRPTGQPPNLSFGDAFKSFIKEEIGGIQSAVGELLDALRNLARGCLDDGCEGFAKQLMYDVQAAEDTWLGNLGTAAVKDIDITLKKALEIDQTDHSVYLSVLDCIRPQIEKWRVNQREVLNGIHEPPSKKRRAATKKEDAVHKEDKSRCTVQVGDNAELEFTVSTLTATSSSTASAVVELQMTALAYWEAFVKPVIDDIQRTARHHLQVRVSDPQELVGAIGNVFNCSDDEIFDLLGNSNQAAQKAEELQKELEQLEAAQQKLQTIGY